MKTFTLIDLGCASAVTASNAFGAIPEAGNPTLRQYVM
jgi:hypothetical protein